MRQVVGGLSKAELVIHPVRLRIVNVLGLQRLTPKQVAKALYDVPHASLYRHIALLAKAGILEVVEQRKVRGMIESVYALKSGAAHFDRDEFAKFTPDEHRRHFSVFLASQADSLNQYISQPEFDTTDDGMTYFGAGLVLSQEQAREFRVRLLGLVKEFADAPRGPDSRLRVLSASLLPAPKESSKS